MSGKLTLTDTSSDHSLSAGGELRVNLKKIDIGGTGKIDYEDLQKNTGYDFKASLMSQNYSQPLQIFDMKACVEQIKEYFKTPGKSQIVSFTLSPLRQLKNFSDEAEEVSTHFFEPLNSMFKEYQARGQALVRYIGGLINEIPQTKANFGHRLTLFKLKKQVAENIIDTIDMAKNPGEHTSKEVQTKILSLMSYNVKSIDMLVAELHGFDVKADDYKECIDAIEHARKCHKKRVKDSSPSLPASSGEVDYETKTEEHVRILWRSPPIPSSKKHQVYVMGSMQKKYKYSSSSKHVVPKGSGSMCFGDDFPPDTDCCGCVEYKSTATVSESWQWCGWQARGHSTTSKARVSCWIKFIDTVPLPSPNFGFKVHGKVCNDWVSGCKPNKWKKVSVEARLSGGDKGFVLLIFDSITQPIQVRFTDLRCEVISS